MGPIQTEHRLTLIQADTVAVIAHQLRQPTAVLLGGAHMLLELIRTGRTEHTETLADAMLRQADRLASLIDDLLVAAQLDTGALRVSARTIGVGAVLELAIEEDDDVLVACDPGILALADPLRLEQIVTQLVSNSLAHGAPPVVVIVTTEKAFVHIDVTDHGPGVTVDEMDQLFERFTPLALARPGGTGLGLSIARDMARAMGGDICYRPNGVGARFELTVPTAAVGAA